MKLVWSRARLKTPGTTRRINCHYLPEITPQECWPTPKANAKKISPDQHSIPSAIMSIAIPMPANGIPKMMKKSTEQITWVVVG